MGVHKWFCGFLVAQQFVDLGSSSFPRICLFSEFDLVRIIYSSSAFSNYIFLFADSPKFLGFKIIFFLT